MSEQALINVFKALADKTRLDIVRTLAAEKDCASCQKVSTCSPLSQPAMSHHFKKLVDAGVLLEKKDGKEKIYELNVKVLQAHGLDVNRL